MRVVALLLVMVGLVVLILPSCSSSKDQAEKGTKPQASPARSAQVLYQPVVDLPGWTAWLGPARNNERLVRQPGDQGVVISYLRGADLERSRAGVPPQNAITIRSRLMKKNVEIKNNLKSLRSINTPIGLAYISPAGDRAYIKIGNRAVVVEVLRSRDLRLVLQLLRWVDESSVKNSRERK